MVNIKVSDRSNLYQVYEMAGSRKKDLIRGRSTSALSKRIKEVQSWIYGTESFRKRLLGC